ncbi:hypothetical protein Tcan_11316 [Toxocara canis]|uniref:Uncharacterized protein n=1 Tax=Toxocara canis TaxID=6265 RepID=A0A0B2VWS6_TOXCA|nr:hypothetical protein Tcan_11316 [Toxocara canis]
MNALLCIVVLALIATSVSNAEHAVEEALDKLMKSAGNYEEYKEVLDGLKREKRSAQPKKAPPKKGNPPRNHNEKR